MQRVGFLILADEMLRRSKAKGIEVRFWKNGQETKIRIERGVKNDLGKKRKV